MKRIYSYFVLLAIIVAGLGYYRGWFTVASDRDAQSHKVGVHLTVDPDKVKEDSEALKDKTKSLTDKVND